MFRRLNPVVVLMTTSSSPFSTVALFAAATAWQTVSKEFHRMRKALMCALLGAALACSGTALYAQTAEGAGQGGGQHQMPSPEMRLQHMTRMLDLSSDQQAKIKPILENESQQMQSLHQDTSMSQQDRMAKMREIRQSTMSQIKPILTAEQQQKLQQMRQEHMQHNRGGAMGGQPPASQPPQQ